MLALIHQFLVVCVLVIRHLYQKGQMKVERKALSGKITSLQEEELTVKRLNHLGCDQTEQEDQKRTIEGAIIHSLTEGKAESQTLLYLTREDFLKLKKNSPKIVRKLAPPPPQIEVQKHIFCIIL